MLVPPWKMEHPPTAGNISSKPNTLPTTSWPFFLKTLSRGFAHTLLLSGKAQEALHASLDPPSVERRAEPFRKAIHEQVAIDDRCVSNAPFHQENIGTQLLMGRKQTLMVRLTFCEVEVPKTTFLEQLLDRKPLQHGAHRHLHIVRVITQVRINQDAILDGTIQVGHRSLLIEQNVCP